MKKKAYKIPSAKVVTLNLERALAAGSDSTKPIVPLEGNDGGEGSGDAKSFSGFYDLEE